VIFLNEDKVHERFMKLAIVIAKKGIGFVNPNPPVGAVIVKDGKILSMGYHKYYGGYHAERDAILSALNAGIDISGSTMYVTLEPCDHYGKTPPCTDLIIQSGIKEVYIACTDPNPISGNGAEKLRKNGVDVHIGLLEEEARELAKFFFKSVETGIPYVTLKYAATLDGKIADVNGNSKWITDELRKVVHKLRSEHMAVLVGAGTVIKDNPTLNVRFLKSKKRNPIKVVLDKRGVIFEKIKDLNVFQGEKVIVFTEKQVSAPELNGVNGVKIFNVLEPIEILKTLYKEERVDSVLVEGGSEIFSQFLPFADEIYGFYGLKALGKGKGIFENIVNFIDSPFDFSIKHFKVSKNKKEFLVVMKRCSQG